MLKGESVFDQRLKKCNDCGKRLELQVCQSAAGFYIGTMCDCGPYSRESMYFPDRKIAENVLKEEFGRSHPYARGSMLDDLGVKLG